MTRAARAHQRPARPGADSIVTVKS